MIVVCQQPNYFPWLGYLEQCVRADTLIILDSVQWIRRGFQHRARILPHVASSSMPSQFLSIPVHSKDHRQKTLGEMQIPTGTGWTRKHWNTLKAVYGRRPYFKGQLEALVRPWYEQMSRSEDLREVTLSSVKLCLEILGHSPIIRLSSELSSEGTKTERLLSLCQSVEGTRYYSGMASTTYLQSQLFRDAGIELIWQRWKHPIYDQGRDQSHTHLSFLDALANVPLKQMRAWYQVKPWGPFGIQSQNALGFLSPQSSG